MKKLLVITLVAGGLAFASARVPMRKCTSRLGSGRASTGIIHTGTITRTGIIGRTTIGLTIGTAGIVTIGTITTIGTKLT